MKIRNIEVSLNLVSRDLQPFLQSVGINQTDETQKRSGAMAEGQTGSGGAEGLQGHTSYTISHFFFPPVMSHQVWSGALGSRRSPTQVSADRTGLSRRTASSTGLDCSMYTTLQWH